MEWIKWYFEDFIIFVNKHFNLEWMEKHKYIKIKGTVSLFSKILL